MFEGMVLGFQHVFMLENVIAIIMGSISGYFIGAMPGLNPTIGIALLIPFTYGMNPVASIVMLISLYMAAEYGGGITAILVNTPGTAAAAATCLDGYPLAQQGKATKALGMSIVSSGIAAFISSIMLVLFARMLAGVALKFGPPEYFALAVFGFSVIAGLSVDNLIKGLMTVALGLLLTTVGLDPIDGSFRFVMSYNFMEGVPFVPAMIGLFAISEVFTLFCESKLKYRDIEKLEGDNLTMQEIRDTMPATLRGTIIGFVIGMIPAAGANVACWVSYNAAKNASKEPELYGKGSLEGIAAAESANNSAVAGAMVPLLTMGIPGSSASAVLIGALMIQGIQPGPLLFTKSPEIPYSIFASLLVSVPVMVALGLGGSKIFGKVTLIPKNVLSSLILATCVLGAYALAGSMFGVWIAFVFGILGFIFKRLNFPVAPMVLALVLGRMAETNYRLSMLMGEGSSAIFVQRPITLIIFALTIITFATPLVNNHMAKKRRLAKANNDAGAV